MKSMHFKWQSILISSQHRVFSLVLVNMIKQFSCSFTCKIHSAHVCFQILTPLGIKGIKWMCIHVIDFESAMTASIEANQNQV